MNPNPRRKRLLVLGGFVLVILAGWLGMEWWLSRPVEGDFSAEVARITGDVPEAPVTVARRDGPVKLAIGPLGLAERGSDGAVADLLVAELSADTGFQLVERRDFARIMQEFELGAAGAIKPADAVKLGRLLGAEWFLLGSAYRSGTNASAVVRLVDAGSGIVRDLLVLRGGGSPVDAAGSLAALLRRQRTGAESAGKLPEFVAVGGFEDLSVRPRHAGVEAELRNHLTATLAAGPMIVLERELTRLLLEEIRLQQAGLIESTNPPPRIQSTFWLVDGFWQSFDSVGDEIDLTLRVSRLGGAVGRKNLRASRGTALETAVASAMDGLLKQAQLAGVTRPATRKGEIRAQLAKGMERSGLTDEDLEARRWPIIFPRLRWNESENTTARRRENYLAAMQAFESVLLLDPGHAYGKLYLARCLVDPAVNQPREAQDLYRELLDDRVQSVAESARLSLGYSYLLHGEARRSLEWFTGLQDKAPPERKSAYKYHIDWALSGLQEPTPATDSPFRKAKEERALLGVGEWRAQALAGKPFDSGMFLGDFLRGRAEGYDEGRRHLAEFAAKLFEAAPEIRPHLLIRVSELMIVTNNPFLGDLEKVLEEARKSPAGVFRPEVFFRELRECLRWVGEPVLRPFSALVSDVLDAATQAGIKLELDSTHLVRMGYALVEVSRWEDALAKFQQIPEQVVDMDGPGPWGPYPAYVVPANRIRACLRQLGRPVPVDPTLIDLPAPVVIPDRQFVFLPDGDRLWIACCDQLVERPISGGAARTNSLGISSEQGPRVMVQSADTLWIGTAGSGLLEVDKLTKRVRRRTMADGLLFDEVRALHLTAEELWLGYCHERSGGVSRLELRSGRVTTFTGGLPADKADLSSAEQRLAPRGPVRALVTRGADELWVGVDGVGLKRLYRPEDSWSTPVPRERFSEVACLAASADWVVMGEAPEPVQDDDTHLLTLIRRDSQKLVHIGPAEGLPYAAVTTVALDGNRLWIGGPSYLAIMDLDSKRVFKRCLMNSTFVSQLAIQGDDVWVRLNRAIYRFPRSLGNEPE
jgi:tetratricopeptide (TPR) repeat protein